MTTPCLRLDERLFKLDLPRLHLLDLGLALVVVDRGSEQGTGAAGSGLGRTRLHACLQHPAT